MGWRGRLLVVTLAAVFAFIRNKNEKEGTAVGKCGETTCRGVGGLGSRGASFLFRWGKFRISPRTEEHLLVFGMNWEKL